TIRLRAGDSDEEIAGQQLAAIGADAGNLDRTGVRWRGYLWAEERRQKHIASKDSWLCRDVLSSASSTAVVEIRRGPRRKARRWGESLRSTVFILRRRRRQTRSAGSRPSRRSRA